MSAQNFPFNIQDLQFSDGQAFVIKKSILTLEKLYQQISTIKYNPAIYKNLKTNLSENARFPPFNLLFYRYIINNNSVPQTHEFIDECLNAYFNVQQNLCTIKIKGYDNKSVFNIDEITGRIVRTFPSLLRDFHFYLLCAESQKFQNVSFSLYNDYFEGLDLKIIQDDQEYYVSLYVATARADFFKALKYKRHAYEDKNEITLRIDLNTSEKCNDIYLAKPETVEIVLHEIEKHKIKHGAH